MYLSASRYMSLLTERKLQGFYGYKHLAPLEQGTHWLL